MFSFFTIIFNKIFHSSRAVTRLSFGNFFINKITLQDSITSHTIYRHYKSSNGKGNKENKDSRSISRLHIIRVMWDIVNNKISKNSRSSTDKELTNNDENSSKGSNQSKFTRVINNKPESIFSSRTEIFSSQSNLNISIFIKEFNKSFETR